MIKHFFASALSVVPILGLVSCSKDQPVTYDKWALTPIEVTPTPGHFIKVDSKFILKDRDNPPVPADSKLVFGSQEGSDSSEEKLNLSIKSDCQSGGTSEIITIMATEAHEIPVASLIPPIFLKRLDRLDNDSLFCRWTIKAENEIGSTHAFNPHAVQITSLEKLETLALGTSPVAKPVFSPGVLLDFSTTKSLHLASENPLPEGASTADLICESFFNHRRLKPAQSLSDVAQELYFGPIETGTTIAYTEKIDSRLTKNEQSCRLILNTIDSKTKLNRVALSPKMKVLFPLPKPTVKGEILLGGFTEADFNTHPVFRISIHNPHPIAIALAFSRGESLTMSLQPVYKVPNDGLWSSFHQLKESVEFKFTGMTSPRSVGKDYQFEMQPGESVTIEASLKSSMETIIMAGGAPSLLPKGISAFIGFDYHYSEPLHLRQYRNWNTPDLDRTVVDISPLPSPIGDSSFNVGWIPHSTWITYSKTGERPPEILQSHSSLHPFDFVFYPPGQFAKALSSLPFIAY